MAKKSKGLYSKVEHEPIHHKTSIGRNPSKTKMNKGQYFKNSSKTIFLVNCPATPKIELININKEAVLVICLGQPAFNRNNIGLKNIPPPIPTIPDINPRIEPIIIDKKIGTFLI